MTYRKSSGLEQRQSRALGSVSWFDHFGFEREQLRSQYGIFAMTRWYLDRYDTKIILWGIISSIWLRCSRLSFPALRRCISFPCL